MTNKPTNKSVQTQEQAIQEAKIKEAKDRVAKKKAYSSFQTWKSDLSENFSDPKAALIKFMEEVVIEYSSSQLEATQKQSEKWETNYLKVVSDKGIEISNLKDKLEAKDKEIEQIKSDRAMLMSENNEMLDENLKLKTQLQQATASSGERGDGEIVYRKHYFQKGKKPKTGWAWYDTNAGNLYWDGAHFYNNGNCENQCTDEVVWFLSEPLTPPSSKRFSLEDVRNKLSPIKNLLALLKHENPIFSTNERMQDLIEKEISQSEKNIQYLSSLSEPSEHTEVKEVVIGRNSSVTKSKWSESLKVNAPEPKEGEAIHKTCPYCEGMWKHQVCIECNGTGKVLIKNQPPKE